ncbi:Crp/Fnr family transcriptional regulator [Sphingobacterium thalpophilum]|uniref:Crp/Fnr family transcriptional regulator n=1 Tax=Sphingobacterium thalpophilum TaxID=259 RepID=UPI002D798EE2|nr:Crp/Fnr family transcriptional regulator [Sphingobacterium thalpophilum]
MKELLLQLIRKRVSLTEDQLAEILTYFEPQSIKKNKHLLEEGAIADRLFFVNKGCLRLYFRNDELSTATRFMAFEQTFLTSIVSFISRQPATEFIQAVEDSEVLSISHNDFTFLRSHIPGWDKFYIYILEYGLTVINNKLSSLLTQTAKERYQDLLKNNPELTQRLSNSNLAAYLAISPETLSRLKSNI